MRLQELCRLQDASGGVNSRSGKREALVCAALLVAAAVVSSSVIAGHASTARPDIGYCLGLVVLAVVWARPLVVGTPHGRWLQVPLALPLVLALELRYGFASAAIPLAIAAAVKGGLERKAPARVIANASQYVLSLALTEAAVGLSGWHDSQHSQGAPRVGELPVIAAAALILYATNYILVSVAASYICSMSLRDEGLRGWAADALAAASTYALTPVLLTLLAVEPAFLVLFLPIVEGAQRQGWRVHDGQRLALSDPLTGLGNRRRFEQSLSAACRGGEPQLLMADLDGFKLVNDTWGHAVGDDLLRAVATRLLRCVRPDDVVARLGGDEFAVLLSAGSQHQDALHTANRLQEALRLPFEIGDREITISASVGISAATAGTDPATLLDRADALMYVQKVQRAARDVPDGLASAVT